jgi:hypothetical protein
VTERCGWLLPKTEAAVAYEKNVFLCPLLSSHLFRDLFLASFTPPYNGPSRRHRSVLAFSSA